MTHIHQFGAIDTSYVRANLSQYIVGTQDPIANHLRAVEIMQQFDAACRTPAARLEAGELHFTRYRRGARLGKADLARAKTIHRATGRNAAIEKRAAKLGTRLDARLGPVPTVWQGQDSRLIVGSTQSSLEDLGL
jgi:hypothetical protein